MIGRRWLISGKVQGVWFRASTKKEAVRLNISGWARNLKDGNVEVIAFGNDDALSELGVWLEHGPELADVINIKQEDIAWKSYTGFDVL